MVQAHAREQTQTVGDGPLGLRQDLGTEVVEADVLAEAVAVEQAGGRSQRRGRQQEARGRGTMLLHEVRRRVDRLVETEGSAQEVQAGPDRARVPDLLRPLPLGSRAPPTPS